MTLPFPELKISSYWPIAYCLILQGKDHLTTYTFNTHQAKHTFCSKCGVQGFYTPRSNPDGRGVAIHCLDEGTVTKVNVVPFDGINWDEGGLGGMFLFVQNSCSIYVSVIQ